MDGDTSRKCHSLETLVAQNATSLTDLKQKLNEIIDFGKDYDVNIVTSLVNLLKSSDPELLSLTVRTIAELSKCEQKRPCYARNDIILSILNILKLDLTSDRIDLVKQCYRALGNLFCDCDEGRQIIMKNDAVNTLIDIVKIHSARNVKELEDIALYFSKCMMNFTLGGPELSERAVSSGLLVCLYNILKCQVDQDDMNDDIVLSALLVLSVINENTPERQFDDEIIQVILSILKETANIEISEVSLDILHLQAEYDHVKTLLASEGAVDLLCSRLELVGQRGRAAAAAAAGTEGLDEAEVKALTKQACDLLIIILTGDDAMNLLYNGGVGATYVTMIRWLDSPDHDLLATAVLAIGNFARSDAYCVQMMRDNIFDKLLHIFEVYNGPGEAAPATAAMAAATRVQHGVLAALRNLAVPAENKRAAAAAGRAAPLLLRALPAVADHHVAYKLLAAIRMLIDGQEGVARQFVESPEALAAAVRWARAAEHAGAAGEAPRLLAWSVKQLRSSARLAVLQVDGCVSCLVSMLVSSHSLMQNEAVLALTLLAIEASSQAGSGAADHEGALATQLIEAEIGKHVAVLVETNCAKMPVELVENLLAFLDVTAKRSEIVADYVNAKVPEAVKKMVDAREDVGDDIRQCVIGITELMRGSSE